MAVLAIWFFSSLISLVVYEYLLNSDRRKYSHLSYDQALERLREELKHDANRYDPSHASFYESHKDYEDSDVAQ